MLATYFSCKSPIFAVLLKAKTKICNWFLIDTFLYWRHCTSNSYNIALGQGVQYILLFLCLFVCLFVNSTSLLRFKAKFFYLATTSISPYLLSIYLHEPYSQSVYLSITHRESRIILRIGIWNDKLFIYLGYI